MSGLTLDAGALIALEKRSRKVLAILKVALEANVPIAVPAGVVGQVWRSGSRQVELVRLLGSGAVEVEELDDRRARAAGQLCGATGTRDVIDASVVLCAKARRHTILTSDVDELRHLDRQIALERV